MTKKLLIGPSLNQSTEAVVEPTEPLPQAVPLSGMVLVLSGKRDVYYVVTSSTCSCPSSTYHPGKPCKHQRKYFPGPKKSQAEIEKESDEERARMHQAKWAGGFNGPREPSETDDWAETRYWQKKAEKQDQEA
jgi:hypothetical protein